MPDDYVAISNSMTRTMAFAKLAPGVDLNTRMMTDYLDELARRHVAVDPTLNVFE
jgi:hypothetical protein